MKIWTRNTLCLAVLLVSASAVSAQDGAFAPPPPPSQSIRLTTDSLEIARLAQQGTSDEVLKAYVRSSPRTYDLDPEGQASLRKLGVSEPVIAAMVAHDGELKRSANSGNIEIAVPAGTNPPAPVQVVRPAPKVVQPPPQLSVTNLPPSPYPVVVDRQPPPLLTEIVPLPPGPDSYWIPGCWVWKEGQFVWASGAWVPRHRSSSVWVGNQWAPHGRQWIWIPGKWR
jgi:hypothetical protein